MKLLMAASLICLIALTVMARPQAEHKTVADSLPTDSLPVDTLPWKEPDKLRPVEDIEQLRCRQDSMNIKLKMIKALLIKRLVGHNLTKHDTTGLTNGRTAQAGN